MTYQPPEDIDINDLVDIRDIKIDTSLPVPDKIESYYRQIKNPNCFRHGDTIVHVSFLETGPSFRDRLKQYLTSGQCMDITST